MFEDNRDLLVIALVASGSITLSFYHFLRVPGVSAEMRDALVTLGRGMTFFIPAFVSLLVMRIPLKDMGFSLGEPKKWLKDIVLMYLIMLPLLIFAARQPDFKQAYPYFHLAAQGRQYFLLAQLMQFAFMFCWEFICRGYLLFGFYRKVGYAAIAIQTIPFVLLHINKPELEALGAVIAGVALGILALRARSFYPAVILHFAVAATLDLLSVLR